MSRWKTTVMARIHELAQQGRILVTRKAVQELEDLDVSLQPSDLAEVILTLRAAGLVERLRSDHDNDQWLYVFNPQVEGISIYLKVAVHEDCVVISFHEYQTE